jgi:ketosteroid isomerase-like protein
MPQWAQSTQGSSVGSDIVQKIKHYEQEWSAAAKNSDSDAAAPLLSEVFVEMDADGSLHDKSEILAKIKADKWEINEVSDAQVVVRGNTAIATGAWHGKGTTADGKAVDDHERWVDTWNQNGKWQCIASASTPAKM